MRARRGFVSSSGGGRAAARQKELDSAARRPRTIGTHRLSAGASFGETELLPQARESRRAAMWRMPRRGALRYG